MGRIAVRLAELGLELPPAPAPVAAYVPSVRTGSLLIISGQIPIDGGALLATGPVPSVTSPDDATRAARRCVLNGLAVAAAALDGDLDRVARVVRVGAFVCSDPDFFGQPAVANGASELLVEIFGDAGRHARAAVGSVALPLGASVEVEMMLEVRD